MNVLKRFIYNNIVPFIGYVFRRHNNYINVIYYHDIVEGEGYSFMKTNIDVFKRQMEYIASNRYHTLRFDDLQSENDEQYRRNNLIIAFDDGWSSNYTMIYDLMKDLGLRYNIYLSIGKIDNDPNYLTWDQVRTMHKSGLVGFGVHTYSHPDMSDLSMVDLDLEFTMADMLFEKELGYKPVDFCYPFGAYSEDSNEYISTNLNYKRIYTSRLMYSYRQNGKLIFGRSGISNEENFRIFKFKLKGYFNVWRKLFG